MSYFLLIHKTLLAASFTIILKPYLSICRGDVRIKFLQTLENFHGKLLDAIYQPSYHLTGIGAELNETQLIELHKTVGAALTAALNDCQLLVLATGFSSSVPGLILPQNQRFPEMGEWYVMNTNPNIHYVGWLMHKFDFRQVSRTYFSVLVTHPPLIWGEVTIFVERTTFEMIWNMWYSFTLVLTKANPPPLPSFVYL